MIRFVVFSLNVMLVYGQPACTSCPPNGLWSAWSDSTSCSVTCGLYGTKSQTRTCTSETLGCPCTGNDARTTACPISPICNGAAAVQCMSPYVKYINYSTKRYQCGNVTSSDDDQPAPCTMPGPACGFCTSSTPSVEIVTDGSIGNTAFDSDSITTDSNGCSIRSFTCTSTASSGPYESTISVNSGALVAQSPSGSAVSTFSMTCNYDGTAWNFTSGGVTEDITRIGCQAVTCEIYPSLC